MKHFFTIIGGMGTEATESYIHLVNKYTPAHRDQEYLNYILVNHATIPDRTSYIGNHHKPNPLIPLGNDIKQQNQFHPDFYVIPCNTAHYFYNQLQKLASAPILHMPKETLEHIHKNCPEAKRIGLIATEGTLKDKIYDMTLKKLGYNFRLIKPTKYIEKEVMHLIYYHVKDNDDTAPDLYWHILNRMTNQLHCDVIILGCTELSLAQEFNGNREYPIADAQAILAKNSVKLEEKFRHKKK